MNCLKKNEEMEETDMEYVSMGFTVVLTVVMFFCMRKEKSLSGFYKTINVCGRGYAFITGYLLVVGIISPLYLVLTVMQMKDEGAEMSEIIGGGLGVVVGGILGFCIGFLLYRRARAKCPEALRKKLFKDMMIIALGATFRYCLFFMVFLFKTWYKLNRPKTYIIDGEEVYMYPGSNDVYSRNGQKIGTSNDERTKAVVKKKEFR